MVPLDPLTGMPGRERLLADLADVLRSATPARGPVSLLVLHLERLGPVNLALGHEAGDAVLAIFADRLHAATPSALARGRLGGTEFGVLLGTDRAGAEVSARDVLQTMHRPFVTAGEAVGVALTLGLATLDPVPTQPSAPLDLLDRAMSALARARAEQVPYVVHQPAPAGQPGSPEPRVLLASRLTEALEAGRFSMEYQPVTTLATGEVDHWEALARWNSPTLGVISPEVFVPAAEEYGVINELTYHTLGLALADVASWRRRGVERSVAVNLSARLLCDEHLADWFLTLLDVYGLAPSALVMELTETALAVSPGPGLDTLHELHRAGVRLSIDDFGAGYTSYTLLRDLPPLAEIKIDRSFVRDIPADRHGEAVVRSIAVLGAALGAAVVAEGVEDQAAVSVLRDLGCTHGQGYAWGRPVDGSEVR